MRFFKSDNQGSLMDARMIAGKGVEKQDDNIAYNVREETYSSHISWTAREMKGGIR